VRGFFVFRDESLMSLISESLSETGFAMKIGENWKVENLK
jgi:hypothetical protein